jgi:hypothetical protein
MDKVLQCELSDLPKISRSTHCRPAVPKRCVGRDHEVCREIKKNI